MKKPPLFLSLLIALIINSHLKVQSQEPATLRGTIVKKLKSKYVKDMEYKLNITLPPEYNSTNTEYPVLIYLDAWMTTGLMNDAYFMVTATKLIDPIILVGISFDGSTGDFFYIRARDYTPTYVSPDRLGKEGSMIPTSGKAREFLKFIKDELIPFINAGYRIDKTDLGILGYSLGGLFSAWALSQEPGIFKRYGICSPSLQWDNFMAVKGLEQLSLKQDKIVFISSTEKENPAIQESITKIKALFERKDHIQLRTAEIKGENHFSGVPATYMRALLKLYEKQ